MLLSPRVQGTISNVKPSLSKFLSISRYLTLARRDRSTHGIAASELNSRIFFFLLATRARVARGSVSEKKWEEKCSDGLACVSSRDADRLLWSAGDVHHSGDARIPRRRFTPPSTVIPLRKRLSSALIRSISLAPRLLSALGLNCASGKVFPSPPSAPSPVSRVLRNFFSLSRENLFVNTIDRLDALRHSRRPRGCVLIAKKALSRPRESLLHRDGN